MFYEQFEKLIACYTDMEKNYYVFKEQGYEELNYD